MIQIIIELNLELELLLLEQEKEVRGLILTLLVPGSTKIQIKMMGQLIIWEEDKTTVKALMVLALEHIVTV
jgi:hypothetical protein